MRQTDALAIINGHEPQATGYRVTFEKRVGGFLKSDHFPERDEPPFKTEKRAWAMARAFAEKSNPSTIVNVYVIKTDWTPVDAEKPRTSRRIFNRYPTECIVPTTVG